ncbi:thiopeptide-type bacteriocin biosynthesis protein [Streptomyces sp. IBSBF 2435]|uniref:thiopeptide-type bacteriocin biosynthesis protein n=1 Tax=Streptomyces sp. IBSBF 2435 TaxID=2903531 RepID=UPI002FDC0A3B
MPQPTWRQVNVAFPDWERAEAIAVAEIAPLMESAEDAGAIATWFFVRKHPCWRIRYAPVASLQDAIDDRLEALVAAGSVTGWTESVYEPEVHAFGGTPAMDSAHQFFHHDSHHLLHFLHGDTARHRRETSLMLCSLMLRAAGLDWYEQGDVWARVAAHRPLPAVPEPDSNQRLHAAVRRLITVDPQHAMQPGSPLIGAEAWAAVYTAAGSDLARLNQTGRLHRGIRDVIAHHVIFAWNRLGLPYSTQAVLTAAAQTVIFGPDTSTERSTAHRVETL